MEHYEPPQSEQKVSSSAVRSTHSSMQISDQMNSVHAPEQSINEPNAL